MIWTLTKFSAFDLAMSFATIKFCALLGVKGGNSAYQSIIARLRNDPADAFLTGCVVAPFLEELVFRGLPCFLIWMFYSHAHAMGIHWSWGFWTSLVFALVHGIEDADGNIMLPLPQFCGGLLLWYIARTHGIMYAMGVHGLTNGVALFITLL